MGTGTCFNVDHVASDPACHSSNTPDVLITGGVYLIGKKGSQASDSSKGEEK